MPSVICLIVYAFLSSKRPFSIIEQTSSLARGSRVSDGAISGLIFKILIYSMYICIRWMLPCISLVLRFQHDFKIKIDHVLLCSGLIGLSCVTPANALCAVLSAVAESLRVKC